MNVAIDAGIGVVSGKLSDEVYSVFQSNDNAKKLHNIANELSHLKSVNPPILKQQLNEQLATKKAAKSVGINCSWCLVRWFR